jgi:hypothetical protein
MEERTASKFVAHDPVGELEPLVAALAVDREAVLGVLVLAFFEVLWGKTALVTEIPTNCDEP